MRGMKLNHIILSCKNNYPNTCRKTPFRVIEIELNYYDSNDKKILDKLITEAESLSNKVHAGYANNSLNKRNTVTIRANCYAGVISEYFWRYYLNIDGVFVKETKFEGAASQIDIEVISNSKKIEVRSSFPRNGVEFAICHPKYQFDILGPYHNEYKPSEIQKDYYVRTFFPLKFPSEILMAVKRERFLLYLVGGATWDMMWDGKISKEKSLIPEDNINIQNETSYRVVPMSYALDCDEIKSLIQEQPKNTLEIGFCIRCGKKIKYSFGEIKPKYYCKDCWLDWYRAGHDTNHKEKYCHRCGTSHPATAGKPICWAKCWQEVKK